MPGELYAVSKAKLAQLDKYAYNFFTRRLIKLASGQTTCTLSDLLEDLADKHKRFVYLLQQRLAI